MQYNLVGFAKKFLLKSKYIIRYSVPNWLWAYLSSPLSNMRLNKYSEKYKSFGDLYPELTFYVIRRRPPGWGFFANLLYVVQGLIYAEDHGYIPVVDMENYWIAELSSLKKINGTHNAWEYFFNQTSEYTLEQVYRSKNVILSNGMSILGRDHWLDLRPPTLFSRLDLLKYTGQILSNYIDINTTTKEYLQNTKRDLSWNSEDTLGVFLRGTSYIHYTPHEGVNPSLDFFVRKIKTIMSETHLNKIYIMTENFQIYGQLCRELSSYSIVPSIRYPKNLNVGKWKAQEKLTYDNGILMGYEKTRDYVIEAYLLSECKNFIGTVSNASAFMLAKSNLDLGKHQIIIKEQVINLGA